MSAKRSTKGKEEPATRGRPPASAKSRHVELPERVQEIDAEIESLLASRCDTMAAQRQIAALQVQRWTYLSKWSALNYREQVEASREAAAWQHTYRQCAQAESVDILQVLMQKMMEQEEAADELGDL